MMNLLHKIKASGRRNSEYLLQLYASIFGVFLCMGCLAGATWAWFSATSATENQTIVAANSSIETLSIKEKQYNVTEEVVDQNGEVLSSGSRTSDITNVNYIVNQNIARFLADSGTLYEISFNMGGTAETQMLMIETPDGVYYTTLENLSVSLILKSSGQVSVYASWGSPSYDAIYFPKNRLNKIGAGTEYIPEIPVRVVEVENTSENASEDSSVNGSELINSTTSNSNTELSGSEEDDISINNETVEVITPDIDSNSSNPGTETNNYVTSNDGVDEIIIPSNDSEASNFNSEPDNNSAELSITQ